ncbi:hypothetical protein THRCLA_20338 [Thraustotheca clavata]|uniref:NADH-ubiquinone reductase complex 1 MLRQ subunit n=1 Tax=Thraustotheca clavata TaxID=74557 RepID=A0A1W0A8T0_9STRA|nr:hypothetical protein THRCLA_20338 [Thraustotheca clavata]
MVIAARAARSTAKTWLSDPATYPIIAIIGFAMSMGTIAGIRFVRTSPDVQIDKSKRTTTLHHDESVAKAFRSHRISIATLKPNPINREEDYAEFKQRQA